MRVYLDTVSIIYLVENVAPFAEIVRNRLSDPEVDQMCSDLSRLECRVKPMRDTDATLLAEYDRYFETIIAETILLSRAVLDRATALRARYGFKTPDSIHLAAAIVGNCDVFLTNDHRLDSCTEIRVEQISE